MQYLHPQVYHFGKSFQGYQAATICFLVNLTYTTICGVLQDGGELTWRLSDCEELVGYLMEHQEEMRLTTLCIDGWTGCLSTGHNQTLQLI